MEDFLMKSRDGIAKVYRTSYGTYKVRFYTEAGRPKDKSCKTKTECDALVRAIKKRADLDFWFPSVEPAQERSDVGTFGALAERWLNHAIKVREISQSCLMNYQSHLKYHVLPVLGDKYLRTMDLRSIEELAEVLRDKKPTTRSYVAVRRRLVEDEFFAEDEGLSASYRCDILTVACMVTKFGFERGYLTANPFREFRMPERPEQPYDYWRLEDEDAFLRWLEGGGMVDKEVCRPHSKKAGRPETFRKRFATRNVGDLYDVVLFALRSGLRKGEIGALTSRDVNLTTNTIVVRRAYSEREKRVKNTTKGKTYRVIEMNDDMRQILVRRMAKAKSEMALLFNTRTWAIKNFTKYCVKAGVREIHFHALRHTCLTNLANGYGMDSPLPLPQVQRVAGHRDIATTMRYVHTNGIENTTSKQWSRDHRRSLSENGAPPPMSDGVQVSPPSEGLLMVAAAPQLKEVSEPETPQRRFQVIAGGKN